MTRLSGLRAGALSLSLIVVGACGDDGPPASGGFGEEGAAGTQPGAGTGGATSNAGRGGSAQGGAAMGAGAAGATTNGGASAGGETSGGSAGAAAAGNASSGNGSGANGTGGDGTGGTATGGNGTGGNGTGGNATGGNGPGGNGTGGNASGGNGTGGNGNGGNPPLDFGGAGGEGGAGGGTGVFGSCTGVADWGSNVAESLSTDGDDWLGAITPDERTIVYFVEKDGLTKLRVADRNAVTDAWGAPVEIGGGPFARDRVALESNGLVLGVLAADRRSFIELRRTARSLAFAPGTVGTFKNIESDLPMGATLADPVMGEGDRTLFLSVVNGGSASTIHYALRFDTNALWGSRAPSPEPELAPSGTKRRKPTGLSADGRTLFFWDETTTKLRRAVRPVGAIAAFDSFADVGFQQAAVPVTSCKRIYYSLKTGPTFDLFHADSL